MIYSLRQHRYISFNGYSATSAQTPHIYNKTSIKDTRRANWLSSESLKPIAIAQFAKIQHHSIHAQQYTLPSEDIASNSH